MKKEERAGISQLFNVLSWLSRSLIHKWSVKGRSKIRQIVILYFHEWKRFPVVASFSFSAFFSFFPIFSIWRCSQTEGDQISFMGNTPWSKRRSEPSQKKTPVKNEKKKETKKEKEKKTKLIEQNLQRPTFHVSQCNFADLRLANKVRGKLGQGKSYISSKGHTISEYDCFRGHFSRFVIPQFNKALVLGANINQY